MKPASTTRSGACPHRRGERGVPVLAGRVVLDPVHEGGHAGALGPGQALDALPVGAHRDHLGAVRRVGAGVEQGLEVGAGAGDEHDEAGRTGRGLRRGRARQGSESRGSEPDGVLGGGPVVPRAGRAAVPQVAAAPPTSPPGPRATTVAARVSRNGAPTSAIRPGPTEPPASRTSRGSARRRAPRAEAAERARLVGRERGTAHGEARRPPRAAPGTPTSALAQAGPGPVGGQRGEQRERRDRTEHDLGRRRPRCRCPPRSRARAGRRCRAAALGATAATTSV